MQFGTAVHCGVLEPHAFADRFVALPNIDRRTKEGKATFAEFCQLHPTKTLFDGPAFDRVRSCVDAVNAHPAARALIAGARKELSLFWTDQQFDVPCKARLDILNGGIADLKTTRNASKAAFARDMANLLYHVSAAQYYDA